MQKTYPSIEQLKVKSLKFRLGWRDRIVFGGPFRFTEHIKEHVFKIKMAKEIFMPFDVNVPTVDFSVPSKKDLHNGLVLGLKAMARNEALYVGCMGGIGRTGLYMAVLARIFDIENPIEWVRANYNSHAVETTQQWEYIMNFPITDLQLIAQKLHNQLLWKFWK